MVPLVTPYSVLLLQVGTRGGQSKEDERDVAEWTEAEVNFHFAARLYVNSSENVP